MSIEVYLSINLIADFALLSAVSRALGLFSWSRLVACDLLCAAYAALAAARPAPWASPVVQLALLVPVSMLLTRRAAPRLWLPVALSLAALAMLCGGIARLTPLSGPAAMLFCVIAGGWLASNIFRERRPLDGDCQVRLCVSVDGQLVRFPALIDTGNRLREPLSGQPVVIAEAGLLKGALPKDGYRVLRFGAVGGQGEMACFRPRAVWIERGRKKRLAPETWVALSPGPLPGVFRALAPPEFAQYAK